MIVAEFVFSRPLKISSGWSQTSYFMPHKLMIVYVHLSLNILIVFVKNHIFFKRLNIRFRTWVCYILRCLNLPDAEDLLHIYSGQLLYWKCIEFAYRGISHHLALLFRYKTRWNSRTRNTYTPYVKYEQSQYTPRHEGNGLNTYVRFVHRCIHPYLNLKYHSSRPRTNITMTINGCILIISF